MKTNAYELVSALIFALVAVMHLVRLLQGWPVMLGTMMVPLWASILAIVVSAAVAIWGFSLVRKT